MTTSGTGSSWRIYTALTDKKYTSIRLIDEFRKGTLDLDNYVLDRENMIAMFNAPQLKKDNISFDDYKIIVNFRDPRDYLCNLYSWEFVHPRPNESDADRKSRMEKIQKDGIDNYVLKKAGTKYYNYIFDVIEKHNEVLINTYARLCLDFDSFIDRASDFVNIPITDDFLEKVKIERPENLSENQRWIGNKWQGSDVMPGRYKRELKPETIEILNNKLEDVLRKMAKYDPDFSHLYLEGIA